MPKKILLFFLLGVMGVSIIACGGPAQSGTPTDTTSSSPNASATSSPTVVTTPNAGVTPVPLHITGVAVAVNPVSLTTISCNATVNLVYTASITAVAANTGGSVAYTWNVGGSNVTTGNVQFAPGDIAKTISYSLNNAGVQYNNTANMTAVLTINSPNTVTSAPIKPASNCTYSGPFVVSSVVASISPVSLTGLACGSTINVTYTATVTIGGNSNGGTVALVATFGTAHRNISVVFTPGSTVQPWSITVTATLAKVSTIRTVGFASTSPNAVSSNIVKPTGQCS